MNTTVATHTGNPFSAALRSQRGILAIVALFSMFVNVLMLAGPLFALQVYDRVLGSRSAETLITLGVIVVFLVAIMAVLDHVRKRLLARVGTSLAIRLQKPVLAAALRQNPNRATGVHPAQLEALQKTTSAPFAVAVFDLPWVPIFFGAIALLHPNLGKLALAGAALIVALPLIQFFISALLPPSDRAEHTGLTEAVGFALAHPDHARALGLAENLCENGAAMNASILKGHLAALDRQGWIAVQSQSIRILMQSAMIGLGAWLVIRGQISPGAIIAATVLLPRAYGPLDTIAQNFPAIHSAFRLSRNIARIQTARPTPRQSAAPANGEMTLTVRQVTILYPGTRTAAVRLADFKAPPGSIIGIHGTSGSGKTSLIRALAGEIAPIGGDIRICSADGHAGQVRMGYLPQIPVLPGGSIQDSITGFQSDGSTQSAIEAARNAGAHERILALPAGYQTQVNDAFQTLPAGLLRQIALARALFSEPHILLLDEPFNDLDRNARVALSSAIEHVRGHGGIVAIASQEMQNLQSCDMILTLDQGVQQSCGPAPARHHTDTNAPQQLHGSTVSAA